MKLMRVMVRVMGLSRKEPKSKKTIGITEGCLLPDMLQLLLVALIMYIIAIWSVNFGENLKSATYLSAMMIATATSLQPQKMSCTFVANSTDLVTRIMMLMTVMTIMSLVSAGTHCQDFTHSL